MSKQNKKLAIRLLALGAVLACLPYIFAMQRRTSEKAHAPVASQPVAQDMESKLSRKADFIPGGKSTKDQLIAVAQYYQIPMGIEWTKQSGSQELDMALPAPESSPTVRDLLQAIVLKLPGYQMTVQNGIVHVAEPVSAADAHNFLNVQIEEFRVEKVNLFDAEQELLISIDMTLHPDEYEDGYVGGYGGAPDDAFAKNNINFKSEDLTVREILDGLVKVSGNALWIAQPDSDDFKTTAKSSSAKSARNNKQEGTKPKYQWKFVPLIEKPGNRI
jgi:hypothetical protein